MKMSKLVMIATFVAFALVSVASAGEFTLKTKKRVVNLSLEQAIQSPQLIAAIYEQVDPDFMSYNSSTYTVKVEDKTHIYLITGTYYQWKLFFKAQIWIGVELIENEEN